MRDFTELRRASAHSLTTDEIAVIVKLLEFGIARVSLGKMQRESAKNALRKLSP